MRTKVFYLALTLIFFTVCLPVAYSAEELIYDFPLKKSRWEYWEEGGARAKFRSGDSKLFLNIITSPSGAFHHIQIYYLDLKIEEGQKYVMKLKAKSNNEAEISCKFHKPSPNWISYQKPEYVVFELSPGGNTKDEEFIANRSTDQARLTCYFGQNKGETDIEINSLKLYKTK